MEALHLSTLRRVFPDWCLSQSQLATAVRITRYLGYAPRFVQPVMRRGSCNRFGMRRGSSNRFGMRRGSSNRLCAEVRATGPSERRVIVAAVLSMCRFEMNRAPRTAAVAKRPGARRCQADIFARYSFGRSGSYASMGGPTAVV